MLRWFYIISFLTLLLLALPVAGFADSSKLVGSAGLMFAGQTAETDGAKTLDASSFVQQYSFLWSREGKLSRGRLGEYNISLGYEWSWVDSEINGQKVQIKNPLDKLLYLGDVKIAPGGLPFRLHAFSTDMHRTSFTSSNLGSLTSRSNQGIVTGINNGTHYVSGITLDAGVQNGHYEGQYRDLLATLPRLTFDYKQTVVHDVRGPNPADYVDRDLAFISLNKKDNWFHYRRFEHEDKIDSFNNFTEDTYLLGTIDYYNRRQWVNLTNWIKVSTDISYTQSNSVSGRDNVKRYDFNFFSKTNRSRWAVDNFTSYSRVRDEDHLQQQLGIPFFAHGELNRDSSWRFQLESIQFCDEYTLTGRRRNRDEVYLRGKVDTFRQARYIVSPQIELETLSGTEGEGQNGKLTIELFSNRKYRTATDLFAGYSILYASGTGTTDTDVSYVENMWQLRLERQFGQNLRLGGEERLVYGTGRYDSTVTRRIGAELAGVATYDGGSGFFDTNIISSESNIFVETSNLNGLKNRLELNYSLIDSDTFSTRQIALAHRLDYDNGGILSLYWANNFVTGDGMPATSVNPDAGTGSQIDGTATSLARFDNSFSSNLRVYVTQGRASRFSIDLDYENINYKDGSNAERARGEQSYEYTFWHVNGRVRKLLVLGEKAEYIKTTSLAANPTVLQTYSVFSNYYPTYNTLLSARLSYEIDELSDHDTLLSYLSAGMTFAKFEASVDYSYGHRPETSTTPDVLEHKWEAKIKKTF